MMMKFNFLCVDIGTTSLKAALVSDMGQVLSFSKIEFTTIDKSKIALEWFRALKESISALKKNQIESLSENETLFDSETGTLNIDAVCISGNGPTIVSEDGTTLLWNSPVAELQNQNASSDLQKILLPELFEKFKHSLFLPRLLAFKNLYSDKFINQKIFSGPEYLIWLLSNTQITILPESRYEAAYWNDEALTTISSPSIGPFVKPGFVCGNISKTISDELEISSNAKIIAGGPDFTVAMIGTNTLSPGKLCNRAGSSEGLNWCTEKPVFAPGLRTLPSVIPNLWNASILNNDSGDRIASDKLNYEKQTGTHISYEDYIPLCLSCKDERGAETLKELSAFISDGVETMRNLAKENGLEISDTVMVTGGQAKNPLWLQHKANVSKINFGISEVPDSELLGDAVLASYALGLYDTIQQAAEKMVKIKTVFSPIK